jgi:hypothetical protein
MKLITLIFCFIFTTHALSQSTVEKTTIYLIRHAEKNDSSKDPELSQKGKKEQKIGQTILKRFLSIIFILRQPKELIPLV